MPISRFSPARHARRWLLALWPLTLGLMACGQMVSVTAPATPRAVCEPAAQAATISLRILVRFHQPTVGNAPAVLARLQTEAGACVRFVSSVSPTLHAYAVDTAADGAEVVARLLRWPAVKTAETDARVQRH